MKTEPGADAAAEEDAEVARATANAPPTEPLPPAQTFPARRETGPMGDRARREDTCAVCYQGEFADYNQILYCDGCNLGLHQHCNNVPVVPEGEDPYWCDYCLVANEYPTPADEPPPICILCRGRGGGLIRAVLLPAGAADAEEEDDEGEGEAPPRFVHKTCALAGMETGWRTGPVRFVAGSNGGVALLTLATQRACDEAVPVVKLEDGDRDERGCRHCGSAYGLLLRCRGPDGEGCPHAAHASCAFEATAAALVVDGSSTTEAPVHVWCSPEHAPPPEKANPGAEAVAACLGLLPPPGSQPQPPQQDQSRPVQASQHLRGASALFAGYVDDKAKLLLLSAAAKGKPERGRVLLVGRGPAASEGGGGGVRVLHALKARGAPLLPPETPRVRVEEAMDTSE